MLETPTLFAFEPMRKTSGVWGLAPISAKPTKSQFIMI